MEIRVYRTSADPFSQQEAEWLTKHNIDYKEVFIDKDPSASEEMVHKSGQMGVPVTEIIENDGKTVYVLGFDKDKLALFLKIPE